jgi:multiple sugar transport system ATP-binding protein
VMNDGRIHQLGTPGELYDGPVDKFVASFIGTPAMGFISFWIQRSSDGVALITDSARICVSMAQAQALRKISADLIFVGIRPEHLTLETEREASATDVSVRGRVEMVEMLGAEQYVHVNTDGGSLTARVARNQPVKVDDTVILAAAAADLHFFDHVTGSALR